MTEEIIDIDIKTIGNLDAESDYENGIRYLALDLLANGTFSGELRLNIAGQKYRIGDFDVLLFLVDIYETMPNLIGGDDGKEYFVMFNDYIDELYLSKIKNTLRLEIRRQKQTIFDANCDIVMFTKRVHSLLRELIGSMYDACPELAEYDLLNPALYNAFKHSWVKSR